MTPRTLIVGGGAIARRGHLPALRSLEQAGDASVGGVVEPDSAAAEKLEREFDVPVFPTLEKAFQGGSYDLVDICTPSTVHNQGLFAALDRRIPALIEKPLLTDPEQIDQFADAVAKIPVDELPFVGVVQNYRYYAAVEKALSRIEKGFLGRLTSITAFAPSRFPIAWTRSTWLYEHGGVLQDFAPHALDLIVLFANAPVARVSAFSRDISDGKMGFPNYCQILIEFENGVLATLDSSWVTGTTMFCVGLHGTGGHIDIDTRLDYYREYHGTYTPFDDVRDFAQRMGSTIRRVLAGEYFRGPLAFYPRLLKDVFQSIDLRRPNSPRIATLAQGINTSIVLSAALASAKSGKTTPVQEVVTPKTLKLLHSLYQDSTLAPCPR